MEIYYLVIVGILILLAISDLVVGVTNDAVNFLNSAIGSKAAPFRIIMIIAALGILFGATFSSGMMEVARKGIFHPDQFFLLDAANFSTTGIAAPQVQIFNYGGRQFNLMDKLNAM